MLMDIDQLVGEASSLIWHSGGMYYFAEESLARAVELGITPSEFYFLGRGGALGDVDAAVADSALGYFAPTVVQRHWRAPVGRSPRDITLEYLECCRSFGRHHLTGDWLPAFCTSASDVYTAASAPALPLFAGFKSLPLPEDPAARAMQLVVGLREYRGGMHLLAVVASGLSPMVAHWLSTPWAWENFGYAKGDAPDVGDVDRERLSAAVELTDRLVAPAFSVLDDNGARALLAGLNEMKSQLPTPEAPG
jgi:hypothetical protein